MRFTCSLRAQYFIKELTTAFHGIKTYLERSTIAHDITSDVVGPIFDHLALDLDRIFLPVIAYEVHNAKENGLLQGDSPQERYCSFFIDQQNKQWTTMARNIKIKYATLLETSKIFIESTIQLMQQSIDIIQRDSSALAMQLFSCNEIKLVHIQPTGSDRHNGGKQALICKFSNNDIEKLVVLKYVNARADIVYKEYVQMLDLQPIYEVRCRSVLIVNDDYPYSWLEYIEHIPCHTMDQVALFYRRAGSLLAVVDSLNFCDGHFENVVANADYPVLIDCETLFHSMECHLTENYVFGDKTEERSILFTGLIQKPPKKAEDGYSSAFQTCADQRHELVKPHCLSDRSDEMKVRYRGVEPGISHCAPFVVLNGTCMYFTCASFLEEFTEGFRYTFERISAKRSSILANTEWLSRVGSLTVRLIVRVTLFYELLIKKLQQPMYCTSAEEQRKMLLESLTAGDLKNKERNERTIEYELECLMANDVPYFTHTPSSTNILGSSIHLFENYLKTSAVHEITQNMIHRSPEYLERSMAIIRNNVKQFV
jgi:lantibiotic modifying enzyme